MKHLYYAEYAPFLTKIGYHEKGYLTDEEVANFQRHGYHFYCKKRLVAKSKGQEVEVRRKSVLPRLRHDVYGVGVESVE